MSWAVSVWNGSTFVTDGTLDNPSSVEHIFDTRHQIDILADGSEGTVIPAVASWLTIRMTWKGRDAAFKNKLKSYIDTSTLSITDLLSNSFVGKFINFTFSETSGVITYDIQADFRQVVYPSA